MFILSILTKELSSSWTVVPEDESCGVDLTEPLSGVYYASRRGDSSIGIEAHWQLTWRAYQQKSAVALIPKQCTVVPSRGLISHVNTGSLQGVRHSVRINMSVIPEYRKEDMALA